MLIKTINETREKNQEDYCKTKDAVNHLSEWKGQLPPPLRDSMLVELAEFDPVYYRLEALEQKKDIILPSFFKEYRTIAKKLETTVHQQVETDQQRLENTGAEIMWTSRKQAMLTNTSDVNANPNSATMAKRRRNSTMVVSFKDQAEIASPKKRINNRKETNILPDIANSGYSHIRVPPMKN